MLNKKKIPYLPARVSENFGILTYVIIHLLLLIAIAVALHQIQPSRRD
jgi:hypothetical protein